MLMALATMTMGCLRWCNRLTAPASRGHHWLYCHQIDNRCLLRVD